MMEESRSMKKDTLSYKPVSNNSYHGSVKWSQDHEMDEDVNSYEEKDS